MGWLLNTFPEPGNNSTEVKRIRYARAYIIEMIGAYLMPDLSRNLVHLSQNRKLPITITIIGSVRFPFLRPRVNHPYTFLCITSFNGHHIRIRQFGQ
ncbi:hypothetical protein Gotur_030677 [Gossypium turneri]